MAKDNVRRLGKYQILEEIGRGANAVVYKARHTALDRVDALKVLRPGLLWEEEAVQRFLREARAAAGLDHPNIVPIYDVGEDQGTYYIAMKCLPGRTVAQLVQDRGPLPVKEALNIALQVADALAYAHERGFVHRDIKPANIIVDEQGHATLTDFGLARALESASMTGSTGVVGTPAYIPPEVWDGKQATPASDVYSLGVVLWEMLAGRRLFEGDTPAAVMRGHLMEPPPPLGAVRPEVPAMVGEVVAKALAKTPEGRYGDAKDLAVALKEAAKPQEAKVIEGPISTKPSPPLALSEQPSQTARPAEGGRSRFLLSGLGALFLLMAALVLGIDRYGRGLFTFVPSGPHADQPVIATFSQTPVTPTLGVGATTPTHAGATELTPSPSNTLETPTNTPSTPTPTGMPTLKPGACIYAVHAGDTLFAIAQRFSSTVSDLAQANSITNVNQSYVGQRLLIPDCETPRLGSDCSSFTYVVKAGDTSASIAERFGTTPSAIAEANNMKNVNQIFVGQELVVLSCNTSTPLGPAQDLSLILTFTARSWIRVALDGETVYEGILTSGDERSWTAKREIALRAGNAGGVIASINGRDLGTLGNYAQVIDYVWRLSDSGQVVVSTPTP